MHIIDHIYAKKKKIDIVGVKRVLRDDIDCQGVGEPEIVLNSISQYSYILFAGA